MLVRLVLISLVLGAALWLSWLGDANPGSPNSIALISIIVSTYVLTIIYAIALRAERDPERLATIQVSADMLTTALLVHVTGGAQSAYTFFFALSIIAAAATHFRVGAILAAVFAVLLFSTISWLGWTAILPSLTGQRLRPDLLSQVEFGRAMALNVAAFVGVGVLAYNLGGQIQQTSASLQSQVTKTADLQVLHQDIVHSLSSGLLTIDLQRVVLTANQVAGRLLERQPERLIGVSLVDVLPDLDARIRDLPERDLLRRMVLECRLPETGKRILGITVSPLRNNSEQVLGRIVNFRDLTEIKKLERNMRKAERLAVVGTLAAGVAHEIRNPLAAISGSIQLLASDFQADDDSRTLMDIVTREADRLNALIAELLDYSNPQPREIIEFDVAALVTETRSVFSQDQTYQAVQVTQTDDSEPGPIEVRSDPGRLRQVLWNLLRNAAQAAKERVMLRVALDAPEPAKGEQGEQQSVLIHVSDDGPGIAEEHIDRIFDPFFTTKGEGTGLGLATCHTTMIELSGSISVENLAEGGCCFTVRVPIDASLPRPTGYTRDDE